MAFNIGELVFAYWKSTESYFVGTIVDQKDEKYYVVFADGDQAWVESPKIKKLDLKEGLKVMAKWSNGSFYPGTIAKIVSGACYIHFDDGDKGWTSLAGIALK